jgi:hypothetical protein
LLFVLGGLGVEMWGGYYFDLHQGVKDVLYTTITTIEETLELMGIQVFLFALLSHLEIEFGNLRIRLSSPPTVSHSTQGEVRPTISPSPASLKTD